jgi:hypothetical protein
MEIPTAPSWHSELIIFVLQTGKINFDSGVRKKHQIATLGNARKISVRRPTVSHSVDHSVSDSISDSVSDSVNDSVSDRVSDSVRETVREPVGDRFRLRFFAARAAFFAICRKQ